MTKQATIKLAYLYPQLLNIYGDNGNIICLSKRAEWHGLELEVEHININETEKKLTNYDLFFIGGGQDSQQSLVAQDLQLRKEELQASIESDAVILAICGGYQMLGKSYETSTGECIAGLGFLDVETKAPSNASRLIGNVSAELMVNIDCYPNSELSETPKTLVGFENHSGRTYINPENKSNQPLAKIIHGFGNNGEEGMEGVNYRNVFGTYLHGSLLPKNPHFADELLYRALKHAYKREGISWDDSYKLNKLDDSLELKAHEVALGLR